MEFLHQTQDGIEVVQVRGKLDFAHSVEFEEKLRTLMDVPDRRFVVLDFADISAISSPSLRSILSLAKRVQRLDGKVSIARPSDVALECLKISGFLKLKIFSVEPSVEEALANIKAGMAGRPTSPASAAPLPAAAPQPAPLPSAGPLPSPLPGPLPPATSRPPVPAPLPVSVPPSPPPVSEIPAPPPPPVPPAPVSAPPPPVPAAAPAPAAAPVPAPPPPAPAAPPPPKVKAVEMPSPYSDEEVAEAPPLKAILPPKAPAPVQPPAPMPPPPVVADAAPRATAGSKEAPKPGGSDDEEVGSLGQQLKDALAYWLGVLGGKKK